MADLGIPPSVTSTREDNPNKKFKFKESEEESYLSLPDSENNAETSTQPDGTGHSGSGDASRVGSPEDQNAMAPASLSHLMNQLGDEMKMVHEAWSPVFMDSENAERVCLDQLDSLLKQAKDYEQSLVAQKEQLRERLKILSHTLKMA